MSGGILILAMAAVASNYLTDNSGNRLTDNDGNRLTY